MKEKWTLFTGLILLTLGVVLQITISNSNWPVILIVSGVLLKLYFIMNKIRKSNYKPGFELLFLAIGLSLFLLGVYLPANVSFIPPVYLKVSGISLKVAFIILFVRKTSKRLNFDNTENKTEESK